MIINAVNYGLFSFHLKSPTPHETLSVCNGSLHAFATHWILLMAKGDFSLVKTAHFKHLTWNYITFAIQNSFDKCMFFL